MLDLSTGLEPGQIEAAIHYGDGDIAGSQEGGIAKLQDCRITTSQSSQLKGLNSFLSLNRRARRSL